MRYVPIIALLALAACDPPAPRATPAATPTPPEPAAVGPEAPLPPVSTGAPRYVGRWAATAALCEGGAWVFEPRRLATAGEVSCDFDEVSATPSGYDIAATCTAQAPAEPSRISLVFAESAKAMMVEGGPFEGPIGLTRCGPLPAWAVR